MRALALFVLLALPLVLPLGGYAGIVLAIATRGTIFAIAAVSLDLMLGAGGLVSFGHAAYLVIGAYAVVVLDAHGLNAVAYVLPAVILAAGVFAVVTGAVALRTRGVNYIMITLAFAQMVYFATGALAAYGGDDGYTLSGRTTVFGTRLLATPYGLYATSLFLLVLTWGLCRTLITSPFGRALRAIRQNRARVEGLGIHPFAVQLTATIIAGAIAALAGVLLANAAEFVAPAYGAWQRSGDLLIMVLLGGAGTPLGAIAGALAVVGTEMALSHVTEHWRLIFGPLLVLAVLLRPARNKP